MVVSFRYDCVTATAGSLGLRSNESVGEMVFHLRNDRQVPSDSHSVESGATEQRVPWGERGKVYPTRSNEGWRLMRTGAYPS